MHTPSYVTPQLGLRSGLLVSFWCVASIALATISGDQVALDPIPPNPLAAARVWFVGVCYAIACGLSWLTTASESPRTRLALRCMIIIAVAALVNQRATDDWLRNLSSIGGLVLCQSLLFFSLPLPPWRVSPPPPSVAPPTRWRHQFRVGELILMTTATAVLLAVAVRYIPKTKPTDYWGVMTAVWLVCPLIAAAVFSTALHRRVSRRVLAALAAAVLSVGVVMGMGWAEHRVKGPVKNPVSKPWEFEVAYAPFAAGYAITLIGFGVAAWYAAGRRVAAKTSA